MAGRRPLPTAIKQLSGNPGHRSLNKNEPQFTGTPACPKHLDKVAKAEWKRVSAELSAAGLLTSVDRAALAAYCAAWSRWVNAEEIIQKIGVVFLSPKSGYPIQSPYVSIANTALATMHRFATEFGMTPSSRSRINVADNSPKSADPFTEFMSTLGADVTDEDTHDEEAELFEASTPVRP